MNARFRALALPARLWVASHRGRSALPSALTVLALTTAVALATGLEISSRSAERELERTAEALAGRAQLEVTGGSAGIREALLDEVVEVDGVEAVAPLLEASFRIRGGSLDGAAIHVLGVDLLADDQVRSHRLAESTTDARDGLKLLAGADSVIITRELADRLAVGLGDPIALDHDGESLEVRPQAILAEGGVADAYGGHLALMDVFTMQVLLDREGWFDRLDVVVAEERPVERVAEGISALLAGRASVRRSAARDAWVESAVGAIRFVIGALVLVGIAVAALVAYSTVSLSVERRLREYALLRTIGLESSRVRVVVWMDAVVYALCASALGLAAGSALAGPFLEILSSLSAYLQNVEIGGAEATSRTALLGAVIAFATSIIATTPPARRALREAPLDQLTSGASVRSVAQKEGPSGWGLAAILAALAPACWVLPFPSPWPEVTAIAVGAAAAAALLRSATLFLTRPLPRFAERWIPGLAPLVGASFRRRPAQTGVTLGVVAGVSAGVATALVLVSSLTYSLDGWLKSQWPGGIYIVAGSPLGGKSAEPIRPEVRELIRTAPGVAALWDHYTTTILHEGEEVLLAASDMLVLAEHGRLPVVEGDAESLPQEVARGGIAVSDAFAAHFDVEIGDDVVLATPSGSRRFGVAGVIRDYAGPAGSLNIDLRLYDEAWPREGSSNLVVWPEREASETIDAIRRRVEGRQDLFFVHGDDLERYAGRVMGQFTGILDAVAGLTALIGGISIMNLLLASAADRRREIALMRAAGGTRLQLSGLVVADAALLAGLGTVIGTAVGFALGGPCILHVVRASLSWWIDFQPEPLGLAFLVLIVTASASLTALVPAWRLGRTSIREASTKE